MTALKNFVSGTPDPEIVDASDLDEKQELLEAAAQRQAELQYMQDELAKSKAECNTLREQVKVLRSADSGENAQREIQRLRADAEVSQANHADLMDEFLRQSAYLEEAKDKIRSLLYEKQELTEKYEARIGDLVHEKGTLNSQLKQIRAPPEDRSRNGDSISLDPFDNQVDQVSEADVKSGVDSLNDSLDAFTMTLLDEAEELANRNSHSRVSSAVHEHEKTTKLLVALAEYSDIEEKRGFLLDANLHRGLMVELDKLFFSGDVVPFGVDSRLTPLLLRELAKRRTCYSFRTLISFQLILFRSMDRSTTLASSNCRKRRGFGSQLIESVEDFYFPFRRIDRVAPGMGSPPTSGNVHAFGPNDTKSPRILIRRG